MTKLIYRGSDVHRAQKQKTLAEQMRRFSLIYRGLKHDGEHATQPAPDRHDEVYRGAHFA
ncbi:MAG: hypothetical protein CME88_03145 [Hirschia sp.]|nr:hypothetical protein [Hirschia sp.]MBF17356.1 hypothetical protein [Hirschia sp.]|tara:strand:+ start:301 stop:480 length:180 start_codon:yes stop_codon:yes gene_type:complete